MAFSMHSHSGEFCPGHARNTLEEMIVAAIARGMSTYALTEHMPRVCDEDLYPEEIEAGHQIADLLPRHQAYLHEAVRLRSKYSSRITLLLAFESELIRASYPLLIERLWSDSTPMLDFWLGSLHHAYTIPIDFDRATYSRALARASGSEATLWQRYFDEQWDLIRLGPAVVGHFDLCRLFSETQGGEGWRLKGEWRGQRDKEEEEEEKKTEAEERTAWKGVWDRVMRNLVEVVKIDALLEVNTAGLRKGLGEPYPCRNVCEEFLKMGGKLTLSDDAHAVDQVGTCYEQAFEFLDSLGVQDLWYLSPRVKGESRAPLKSVSLRSVRESFR